MRDHEGMVTSIVLKYRIKFLKITGSLPQPLLTYLEAEPRALIQWSNALPVSYSSSSLEYF